MYDISVVNRHNTNSDPLPTQQYTKLESFLSWMAQSPSVQPGCSQDGMTKIVKSDCIVCNIQYWPKNLTKDYISTIL